MRPLAFLAGLLGVVAFTMMLAELERGAKERGQGGKIEMPASGKPAPKPEDEAATPKGVPEGANLPQPTPKPDRDKELEEIKNLMAAWTWEEGSRNPDPAKIEAIKKRLDELLKESKGGRK